MYAVLEIVWRGYTHWTMMLAGGICLCLLERIDAKVPLSLPLRAVTGAAVITAVELLFGCVFNLWLGWQIWDYSARFGNLWGQICPLFFVLWFLLCLPVMTVLSRLRERWATLLKERKTPPSASA